MDNLRTHIEKYLKYCDSQKRLDEKTQKAYRIDLTQFENQTKSTDITKITSNEIEDYIAYLHKNYKPKTAKRKIASLKAFFHYLEYKDIIEKNPFNKLQIRFREPVILPKTIPLNVVEVFLETIYNQNSNAHTEHQRKTTLRDAAISEMLFATGMRISELCQLKNHNVNLYDGTILIYGKGNKERRLHVCNSDVINILNNYYDAFQDVIKKSGYFFTNQNGNPISDQAVRRMINKYVSLASIDMHITPHMFRHTFATSLLEADVDIRYIQEMLGHSSINITEIYTHVAVTKQRDILASKHPRKNFKLSL